MSNIFFSEINECGSVQIPEFTGIRILHMPFLLGDLDSLPDFLSGWSDFFSNMFGLMHIKSGIAYVTIDQKNVQPGKTHRRKGLHVDGVMEGKIGCTFGGGPFGTLKDGMYTVSSHQACRAWNQFFDGMAGWDGECDHLLPQAKKENEILLKPNEVYWLSGLCVHESMPVENEVNRTFVRITMPNDKPWFDGFTLNPKGIKHEGKMMPRRTKFMDEYKD